jgi:GntR family transcriptional regulator/MocR family aminotransferase
MRDRWRRIVSLDAAAGSTLSLAITRGISQAIRDGRLAPGDALPGSRTLADELAVHRNTVLAAYRELVAEGWLSTSPARATLVAATLPEPELRRSRSTRRAAITDRSGLGELCVAPRAIASLPPLRATERGTLVLAGGTPDTDAVPTLPLVRAMRRLLGRPSKKRALLGYGDPRGEAALRKALAEMLGARRAMAVGADELLVTSGSQQALDLVARTLLRPGDRVAVEALGYAPAFASLRAAGATLVPIAIDDQGIDVERLTEVDARAPLRAIYLTPHHQYPTTVTLSASRRLALLALARRRRIAILEDDYDNEFHYEGRPVLPLAADRGGLDSAHDREVVIYLGTLSKVLAPGLRLGFVAAPRGWIDALADARRITDRQGVHLLEAAAAELIEDGELARHIQRMRRRYRERRDALVAALGRHCGGALATPVPRGGLALWCTLAEGLSADAVAEAARAHGVVVQPRSLFSLAPAERRPGRQLRLGFAAHAPEALDEAARRLGAALASLRRGRRTIRQYA